MSSKLDVSLLRASGYGGERGQPPTLQTTACQGSQPAAWEPRLPLQCPRFRGVGGFGLKQRGRSGGFTLAEMLISVVLLAFLVLFVSRLVDNAATITTVGNKRMDADSQARQLLDRMAVDFDQMLKRNDVSYYLKAGGNNMTGNVTTGVNDRMAFFSAVPGYLASSQQSYPSNTALVAYRVNAADPTSPSYSAASFPRLYNRVERMGKGLNLNGAYSGAITPLVFLDSSTSPTTTIASIWPAATSASATDSDYEVAGPQVFRVEYYYLTSASPSKLVAYPTNWTNVNLINIKDVSAIVVAIAVIDPKSRVLLDNSKQVPPPNDNTTKLAGRLVDFDYSNTLGWVQGQLLSTWQTALDGTTDIPRAAISGVRLYERYFYLSQ